MTNSQKLVAMLFSFALGFSLHALFQPQSKRVFYTRCDAFNCQIRASMPWWTRDVVLYTGPSFSLSLGQDDKNHPIIMQSAENVAFSLSHLVGYGGHWKIK